MKLKQCTQCARNGEGPKPLASFSVSRKATDGLQSMCKACHKARYATHGDEIRTQNKKWRDCNKARMLEHGREWRKRNPLAVTAKALKQAYGLTIEAYEHMYDEQNGRCKICVTPILTQIVEVRHPDRTKVAHVDHCHETNVVRGLLCFHCNVGLGKFKDNIQSLLAAARYLQETAAVKVASRQGDVKPDCEIEPPKAGPRFKRESRASRLDELNPFI